MAAAAVQRRGLPAPLWGISYCPKGPILDYTDAPLLGDVLRLLAEDARRGGSVVLTVEPEAELQGAVVGALREAGYRPSPAQLQSSGTVLVDLEGPEEALLGRMSSTWRRYVRKAAREGVTVRQGTAADLPRFYELYLETSERDHFIPRPADYIERLWGHLAPSGTVGLLLAEVEGVPEAALLPMSLGRRAWYLYGASSERGQAAHAAYLIQWEAMRWARERGCAVYDMWGAPNDPSDKDDPLAGVYYFKRGFGGRHVRWVGAYDAVLVPPLYGLWNEARPRVLEGWRRAAAGGADGARAAERRTADRDPSGRRPRSATISLGPSRRAGLRISPRSGMEVSWLGGSCFRLHAGGLQIITDPFDLPPGAPPQSGDVATVSRRVPPQRLALERVYRVVDGPGEYEIKGVPIAGIATFLKGEAPPDSSRGAGRPAQHRLHRRPGRGHRLPPGAPRPAPDVRAAAGDGLPGRDPPRPRRGGRDCRCPRRCSWRASWRPACSSRCPPGASGEAAVERFCRELGADPQNVSPRLSVTASGLPAQTQVRAPDPGAP